MLFQQYISVMIIYQHWVLKRFPLMYVPWNIIYFKKKLVDTCTFLGPRVHLFSISVDVSSGFQSQSGQTYSHLELLVWHLPTSWWPAWRPIAVPFQRCEDLFDFIISRLAKVSLFPLLITSIKVFLSDT